jgi:hypothetical protein
MDFLFLDKLVAADGRAQKYNARFLYPWYSLTKRIQVRGGKVTRWFKFKQVCLMHLVYDIQE